MVMFSVHTTSLLLLLLCGIVVADEEATQSDVQVLTDGNFEHDTQASTGATTGPWLVKVGPHS